MLKCVTFAAALVACFGVARAQDGPAKAEQLKKEVAELRAKLQAKEAELEKLVSSAVDYRLSAGELYAAYEANREDAAKKYRGKKVLIYGNVEAVREGPSGAAHVFLKLPLGPDYGLVCVMRRGHDGDGLKLRRLDPCRLIAEVHDPVGRMVSLVDATVSPTMP